MAIVLRRAHALTEPVNRVTDDSVLFERLIEKHQARLYRVAYRMAGDHDEAQDLLQDALIEAFRAFPTFRHGTFFDRWLYRIMTRTFIDRQRSRKRTRTESLDSAFGETGTDEGGSREIADSANDPSAIVEREMFAEPIEHAMAALPPDYRIVLILSDIEEMSYDEIASAVNCPLGTVKSRLYRARTFVKEALQKAGYAH